MGEWGRERKRKCSCLPLSHSPTPPFPHSPTLPSPLPSSARAPFHLYSAHPFSSYPHFTNLLTKGEDYESLHALFG